MQTGGELTTKVVKAGRGSVGGLRELLSRFEREEGTMSPESLLIGLVKAVRDGSSEEQRTVADVAETARSRRRRLGMMSFGAGPLRGVATRLVDLYCDTAVLCEVADAHGLELSDEQVAAHMLTLWSIVDRFETGLAAIEGRGESAVSSILTTRLSAKAGDAGPKRTSARAVVTVLWDARGAVGRAGGGGATGGMLLARRRTNRLIKRVERELGVG